MANLFINQTQRRKCNILPCANPKTFLRPTILRPTSRFRPLYLLRANLFTIVRRLRPLLRAIALSELLKTHIPKKKKKKTKPASKSFTGF